MAPQRGRFSQCRSFGQRWFTVVVIVVAVLVDVSVVMHFTGFGDGWRNKRNRD
jgi:hypothetical protein